jgi:hypothetical protein
MNGINYQYVKKRFYNDTLEILCIPNFAKSTIKESKNDYAKQLNEIAASGGSKKTSTQILKSGISDFTEGHQFHIDQQLFTSKLKHETNHRIVSSFEFLQRLEQPPEA